MKTSEHYQAAGIAVTIGGLERARDLIQQQIDQLAAQLAGLRGVKRRKWKQREPEEPVPDFKWERKNHKSIGASKRGASAKSYWTRMSPPERAREMKRRMEVRQTKRAEAEREKKFPVADARNPNHENWLKKLKAARKRAWKTMTAAEKEAWKQRMKAAKKKHDAQVRSAA